MPIVFLSLCVNTKPGRKLQAGILSVEMEKKISQQAKPSALPFHYALQCEVPHTVHQSSLTQFHISTTGHTGEEHDLNRAFLAPAPRIRPKTCKGTREKPVIHLLFFFFSSSCLTDFFYHYFFLTLTVIP